MTLVYLDEDNVDAYTDYLTPDIAENIGRIFYRGLIAEKDGQPVGGMVWEVKNMTRDIPNENFISFLRIEEKEAGELIFNEYKTMLGDDEAVRSSFSIPALSADKEPEALKEAGFSVNLSEGDLIRCPLAQILPHKAFSHVHLSEHLHPLEDMTQGTFNSTMHTFASRGFYGICEDLQYLGRYFFDNDISCYYEAGDDVNGIFLFHRTPSGALMIAVMAALGSGYKMLLPQMIKFSVEKAREYYPEDTVVLIDRHNYASLALSEKLFPNEIGIPIFTGTREEIS